MVPAPVFESPESWRIIGQVPTGVRVIAMDLPRVVEGYLMVPIVPSGAVELTLFREPERPMPEVQLPDADALKAAIDGLQRPAGAWRRLCRRARSKVEMTLTGGSSAGKKGRCTNGRWGRGCGVQQREETERNQSALITRVE
ncbi:unnamed protein product [Cladocopium goreaui]|uniref:GAR domain-containing protein n=1 Tax=Cladocopium goreaui TaxID=2562237 RepID=A0A9P1DGD3_9DINO|nr:unnamed protein product [Cladocopium goreaui]